MELSELDLVIIVGWYKFTETVLKDMHLKPVGDDEKDLYRRILAERERSRKGNGTNDI